MIKVIDFLSLTCIIIGGWLFMISGFLFDLEYTCGIQYMSREAVIRLAVMFLFAIVSTVSGVLLKRRTDNHKC